MNKKGPKKRNRLEGQVQRAAQLGAIPAQLLATVGGLEDSACMNKPMADQAFSRMMVRLYVGAEADYKNDEALRPHFRRIQKSIAKYLLKAIEKRDAESIRRIADEIEQCRKNPNLIADDYKHFLAEKYRVEKTGDKVTVNQIKDYLSTIGIERSYEQVKYLCRRLKIPTVRDKIGRKKIRENKAPKKA